jgi:anaerobic selenocysteine-containing dehydrogenase
LASWLTDALNALTGNLDRPGGAMFPRPSHSKPRTGPATPGKGFATGRWTSRVNGSPEVNGELPSAEMADEILTEGPGQIRAMITLAGNPVRSCPDSQRLDAAFDSLEFMVSVDIYVNETTRHADVILPSPSPLAKPHYDLAFHGLSVRNVVNFSEAILSPEDPSEPGMDEHEILARLALIVSGFGAEADPQLVYDLMFSTMVTQTGGDLDQETERTAALGPIERLIDVMVRSGPYDLDFEQLRNAPHGIDLGPLEPRLAEILRTPSARVELAPPILVDDLTRLTEALNESPADGLLLVGRRHLRSNNSWMHNLPVLVKGKPRCTLQVHPSDAETLGLTTGEHATVTSAAAAVDAVVEVTDAVAPGTVSLPHGWGHDIDGVKMTVASAAGGTNSNALTSSEIDPVSGNAQLNAIPVTIAAATGQSGL